ncbi:hypothetical protein N2152v2_010518 [Parachlorella kessleri]
MLREGGMDTKSGLEYFAPYIVYSESPPADLRQVILDPTNASNAEPVLIVMYPQGSWAPSGHPPGGALFYAYPFGDGVPISYTEATLEYDVYLPPDFEFIKGGKLPGLGGGPRGCGGGVDPIDCWSVRVMWRREGAGEAYMYVPEGHQGADFCDQPPRTKCDYHAGVSLSRGAFYFQPGQWHHIALTVQMNDVGQANGVVEIRVNGERKIYYNQVAYRTKPGIQVDSVVFSTWYGGGDATWSPTEETFTLFKNIQLYRTGSPIAEKASGVEGQAVEAAAAAQPVVVTLPLEDIEPQY